MLVSQAGCRKSLVDVSGQRLEIRPYRWNGARSWQTSCDNLKIWNFILKVMGDILILQGC